MKPRFVLFLFMIVLPWSMTMAKDTDSVIRLKADMLKYISGDDRSRFEDVTERLKTAALESGDERTFYTAWGNQAIYEATHQYYTQAMAIINELKEYAEEAQSPYGQYMAIHANAVTLLQRHSYDDAEEAFQEAVDFRHNHFPNESAAEDIQELMKIANHRKDAKAGAQYARQILAEPNVAPIHQGRALFRLSQIAFNKRDTAAFDHLYQQMDSLREKTGIGTREPVVEVNYQILHGNYDKALMLTKELAAPARAERLALIYHLKGDNEKAYQFMEKFKKINDSIVLVSHGNMVASCFVQMNNERMKYEQTLLERQNNRLRNMLYMTLALALFAILSLILYQRQQKVNLLQRKNKKLTKDRDQAEKALSMKNEFLNSITRELREPLNPITGFSDILGETDYELQPEEREVMSEHIKSSSQQLLRMIDGMAELSFYESKKSLPQDTSVIPNVLCRHFADAMQTRCQEGVRIQSITQLPDNYAIKTNPAALEAVLKHLIDNAIRFTDYGTITLACEENGKGDVRFSVSDTGFGIQEERKEHILRLIAGEDSQAKYIRGFGLSICLAIMKLLKGRLWLDTEYNKGARFCFEIPQNPGENG